MGMDIKHTCNYYPFFTSLILISYYSLCLISCQNFQLHCAISFPYEFDKLQVRIILNLYLLLACNLDYEIVSNTDLIKCEHFLLFKIPSRRIMYILLIAQLILFAQDGIEPD